MPTFKQLNIKHKDYNPIRILKNDLLYKGGIAVLENAELFLGRQGEDESPEFYQERLMTACDPIFANTLERLKSLLFANPLQIVPSADTNNPDTTSQAISTQLSEFLKHFQKDCDGRGTSLHNFAKQSFLTALKHDHALTLVDLPKIEDGYKASNYSDQIKNGELNGYLVDIPLLSVINWQLNETGDFDWLVIATETDVRDNPLSPLFKIYKFITISMEDDNVVVRTYERAYNVDNGDVCEEDDMIPEISTVVTSFPCINVVEMCLGEGLSFGNVIAPQCEQLYRTDATINAAAQRNVIFSLPVLMAGANLPAAGVDTRRELNVVQMDPNRFSNGPQTAQKTNGWMLIGSNDDAKMLETEGKGMAALQEQKKIIIERINAAVHQVAQNIQARGAAQAQSAAAKQEDMRDTEIILSEFKLSVEHYILKIVKLLLHLRGEQMVELDMKGLNVEDDIDRKEVLAELMAYGRFPDAPIFKVNYEYNNALALIGDDLSDDDKLELRKQIEDSISKQIATDQQQMDPNVNNSKGNISNNEDKSANKPNATDDVGDDKMSMGPGGQPLLPEGSHLQTGEHIDSSVVFDQLSEDYKPSDLSWVKMVSWRGPVEIPLSSINFANKDQWKASQEGPEGLDKVNKFAEKMDEEGFTKPIIVANTPHNDQKMEIIDGRHRSLAAKKAGIPIMAYVADVGSMDKDTPHMQLHGKQIGLNDSGDIDDTKSGE